MGKKTVSAEKNMLTPKVRK